MLANPMIVLIIARFIFSQIAPNDFINLILVKNEFCCYADKKDDFAKVVRLDFTLPQINCPVQYFKFIHHQSPCNVQKQSLNIKLGHFQVLNFLANIRKYVKIVSNSRIESRLFIFSIHLTVFNEKIFNLILVKWRKCILTYKFI